VTPRCFKHVIRYLHEHGYTSLNMSALCTLRAVPPKSIVITFDDGYDSIYTYAYPILQEYGFHATIFIISGYIGLLNRWDVNLGGRLFQHISRQHITELHENGWEIGSHTVNHPDLTRVTPDQVREELRTSKEQLEEILGSSVASVSFPFGRYSRSIITSAAEAGYSCCCGFWRKPWTRELQEPFVFERKAFYLFDNILNLKAKIDGGALSKIENIKLRIINFCSHGTALVKPHNLR